MQVTPYKNKCLLLIADISDPETFKTMGCFPSFSKWVGRSLAVKITRLNVQHVVNNWPMADWIGGSQKVLDKGRVNKFFKKFQNLRSTNKK